ncbi:MAG: PH domain-containing protein [Oscillospiraceae bacterium]|nr:PH domain-containing protein [Oscillospiraceae bacterium]
MYRLELMFPDYFKTEESTVPEIVIWTVMALAAAIYILYILIFLPLWYNSAKYCITDTDLISVSGVFFKSTHYMKISAVQYATLISAPLAKHSGFNFIVFSAHGGRMTFIFISKKDAEEIMTSVRKHTTSNTEISENNCGNGVGKA